MHSKISAMEIAFKLKKNDLNYFTSIDQISSEKCLMLIILLLAHFDDNDVANVPMLTI